MRQVVHRLTFPLGGEMHMDHQLILPTFGRAVMVTLTVPIDTIEWTEITLEFRILSSSTRPHQPLYDSTLRAVGFSLV